MKKVRAGQCHIRKVSQIDYRELERIYLAHEGRTLPEGYFSEFQVVIRNREDPYFVAELDGQVLGGGGIWNYIPGVQAHLTFGVVDPEQCRKGYGTALMLARLLYIDAGLDACQITLEATEWSLEFFTRLGFFWHGQEQDERGHLFFSGSHMLYPGDEKVFRKILSEGGVSIAEDWNEGVL